MVSQPSKIMISKITGLCWKLWPKRYITKSIYLLLNFFSGLRSMGFRSLAKRLLWLQLQEPDGSIPCPIPLAYSGLLKHVHRWEKVNVMFFVFTSTTLAVLLIRKSLQSLGTQSDSRDSEMGLVAWFCWAWCTRRDLVRGLGPRS